MVSTRLLHVETSAALALAGRLGRLSAAALVRCRSLLDELWPAFEVVEVDEKLMLTASTLAHEHALRGYDSVHCAAASLVNDADAVAATGDQKLLAAWSALGVATYDPGG